MLADAEVKAGQDQAEAMERFRSWATRRVPGAQHMNVGSGAQIRQLLFAGVENQKPEKGVLEHEKVFKVSHSPQLSYTVQPCICGEVVLGGMQMGYLVVLGGPLESCRVCGSVCRYSFEQVAMILHNLPVYVGGYEIA